MICDFRPDYVEYMSSDRFKEYCSKEYCSKEFTGPGWYLTKTHTMLVVPDGDRRYGLIDVTRPNVWAQTQPEDTIYIVSVWNRTGIGDIFNAIINAPCRLDE
jgi:hypothetical protein